MLPYGETTEKDGHTRPERKNPRGACGAWPHARVGAGRPARTYWAAADDHERANGRLYREVQFALPNELSPEARRELAGRFAAQLTDVGEDVTPCHRRRPL